MNFRFILTNPPVCDIISGKRRREENEGQFEKPFGRDKT